MQMQNISNHDNEIHRVTGDLDQLERKGFTNTRIEKRIETLENSNINTLI